MAGRVGGYKTRLEYDNRTSQAPVSPPGPGTVVIFKPSFVAAHSPSHDCLCLAVRAASAPGPGAVVIFKPSFVAAHSPSHDRLCLAIRAMLLRLTLFI